jgi:hypothetical protein
MKALLILIAGIMVTGLGACKKEAQMCKTPARVVYEGPPETDGCDWVIISGRSFFHPQNLSEEFKQNNLKVNMEWTVTGDTFRCSWTGKLPIINITCMERAEDLVVPN